MNYRKTALLVVCCSVLLFLLSSYASVNFVPDGYHQSSPPCSSGEVCSNLIAWVRAPDVITWGWPAAYFSRSTNVTYPKDPDQVVSTIDNNVNFVPLVEDLGLCLLISGVLVSAAQLVTSKSIQLHEGARK